MTLPLRLQAAAFGLLAALPLGMAIANRSATLIVALAALASLAARVADGTAPATARRALVALRQPLALTLLTFLLLAAVSLTWSHHRGRSLAMLGELTIAASAPFVLHLCLPRSVPRVIWRIAAILVALGAASILLELATGSVLRAAFGFRSETFIFKRSSTAILLVLWPIAFPLWSRGQQLAATALAGPVVAAILWAHAAAAAMGFMAGVTLLLLCRGSRRVTTGLLAAGLAASLLAAPAIGNLAARTLNERTLDALHDMQARDRILIWQSFGEVVRVRPLSGTGFGTAASLGVDPVAAEVPADRRTMLAVGHPHNGYLQVWAEVGLAGALLAGLALALLMRGVARLPQGQVGTACAVIGAAGAIMLVAHGAWQGWWITSLGAAAIWTVRLPAPRPPRP